MLNQQSLTVVNYKVSDKFLGTTNSAPLCFPVCSLRHPLPLAPSKQSHTNMRNSISFSPKAMGLMFPLPKHLYLKIEQSESDLTPLCHSSRPHSYTLE